MSNSSSPGCASNLSKVIAGFLAVLLIIGLPISLLANSWAAVLFSPDRIAEAISARLIDSGVIQDMAIESMLSRGEDEGNFPRAFDFLDDAGRRILIDTLFPPGWVKEQIDRMVQDLYAWIDSPDPSPKIHLDVQSIKDRLHRGAARDLVVQLVDSWPGCGLDQIEQLRSEGLKDFSILCQPPEPLRSGLINEGTEIVLAMIGDLPSTVEVGDEFVGRDPQEALRLKENIRLFRAVSRLGWLVPLSMLGLITAVVVRTVPSLLQWWGAPLLAAGGTSFIVAAAFRPIVEESTREALLRSELPPFLTDTLLAIGADLLDAIMGRTLLQAILVGFIGAVLLGIGVYLSRRNAAPRAA